MELIARKGDILDAETDLLVVGMYKEEDWENPFISRLQAALGTKMKKLAKAQDFEGKPGQTLLFPAPDAMSTDYIMIVGLGKMDELPLSSIREAAGNAIQTAKKLGLERVAIEMFGEDDKDFDAAKTGRAMAEALLLADYSFSTYKKKKGANIKQIDLVAENGNDARRAQKAVESVQDVMSGVTLARDLVNTPAQDMTPTKLAEAAREIAASSSSIRVKVLDREQCAKKKMGAYLAVDQGSDEPLQFIHLTYKPKGRAKKVLALVGKGITFDSGGLSIKPSKSMETMKCDMAGAASVLGAFKALARLQPKVEVHGIIAATENLPSGKAIKPGDIVRASNGKTIEILNTDAEGRLALADSIHYASKLSPDAIIDLATLTGACVVSLGEEVAGVMSNNAEFANAVLVAAAGAGEKMWQLPLEQNYRKLIESDVADLRNTATSRYGGSITAGLFLKEFVPEDVAWTHIDIAGPAFAERPIGSYLAKGGTGFGVRTLVSLIENL